MAPILEKLGYTSQKPSHGHVYGEVSEAAGLKCKWNYKVNDQILLILVIDKSTQTI